MDKKERIYEIAERKGKKALYLTLASTALLFFTTKPFFDIIGTGSTKETEREYWALYETKGCLEREIENLEDEKNKYLSNNSMYISKEIKRKLNKFTEKPSLEAKIKDAKEILEDVKLDINRPKMQDYRFENASRLVLAAIPSVFLCLYFNRLGKRRDEELANIND